MTTRSQAMIDDEAESEYLGFDLFILVSFYNAAHLSTSKTLSHMKGMGHFLLYKITPIKYSLNISKY